MTERNWDDAERKNEISSMWEKKVTPEVDSEHTEKKTTKQKVVEEPEQIIIEGEVSIDSPSSPEPEINKSVKAKPFAGNFSQGITIKPSKKVLVPFLVLSGIFVLGGFFPDAVVDLLVNPEQMKVLAEQSETIAKALPTIIKFLMFILSAGCLILGYKQVSHGTLKLFDSYVIHKKGLRTKSKILYSEFPSMEVHRSPFSIFFPVGNIEISTPTKEMQINNILNPFEIKSIIKGKILNQ